MKPFLQITLSLTFIVSALFLSATILFEGFFRFLSESPRF